MVNKVKVLPKVTPTRGESLFIWRRREGLNQEQAAAEYGVPPGRYRDWEGDRQQQDQPRRHLGILKPNEVCVLLRRRAKKFQRELAEEIGITRLWVVQMEDGIAPIDRLVDYWGE